jgi:hypothetical protein
MMTRRTVKFAAVLAVTLALIVWVFLRPERGIGLLESYSGKAQGFGYAGVGKGKAGGSCVLFKYFNGGSRAITFRARAIQRQHSGGGEWAEAQFEGADAFQVPPHSTLTFEFSPPEGEEPWRAAFEEAAVPNAAERLASIFKRVLQGQQRSRGFDGVSATPTMQGLEPTVEPRYAPNDGPVPSPGRLIRDGTGLNR